MANTINLAGDFERVEGVASEAISPGELVERGGSNDYQAHSTQAGTAQKAFALENDLVGDGTGDDYDSGDTLQIAVCHRGARVQARCGGTNISANDFLQSDGAGRLEPVSTTAAAGNANVVGVALEAQTTADGLVEIEVL